MQLLSFEEGDEVWFHNGGTGNPIIRGTVEQILTIDGYDICHYLIEVTSSIESSFFVRTGLELSDKEDKPIGMWRKK